MAFRTACFISMIFVPAGFRWVLFACAVFLPYVAVMIANQAEPAVGSGGAVDTLEPDATRPQLTAGEHRPRPISGDVDRRRVPRTTTGTRDERVA